MIKWFKNTEGQVRSGWKLLLAFGLMTILSGVFSFPILLIQMFRNSKVIISPNDLASDPLSDCLLMLAQLLSVVLTVFICIRAERKKWRDVGFSSLRHQSKNLLFGLGLGAGSMVIITLIMLITRQITMQTVKVTPHLLLMIGLYFIGFIFVAVNEELFFRGYVVTTLKQTKSTPIIYIGSGLVFGIAHMGNPNVHTLGIVNVALIGLLFAYMYVQTQSLWMSMGYHFIWNFLQGNILGFNVSGTEGNGFFQINSVDNIWTGGSFGVEASIWTSLFILAGFLVTKLYISKNQMKWE
jgi:membrane protease YdiL (CAAX protease family)